MHIVHISSVHNAEDPRIRRKQLKAIVDRGWRATFVTGDLSARQTDGLSVVRVKPGNRNRFLRVGLTAPLAIFRAFQLRGDIYHFHDPELLAWAWLLRLKRRPVIYDVHEDYVTSLEQKSYLPLWARHFAGKLWGSLERRLAKPYTIIIAEKYYRARFPVAIEILNYPVGRVEDGLVAFDGQSRDVLYTGNVSPSRGALLMARAIAVSEDYHLYLVGRCDKSTATAIRETAGNAGRRISIHREGDYLPFSEILRMYRRGHWLAGLAVFPDTPHYRDKELTKIFEYMAMGLPIVASAFPRWRTLVEGHGVGLCVNPQEPTTVTAALDWLRANPDKGQKMAERGQQLVKQQFNWATQAEALLGTYARLLSPH